MTIENSAEIPLEESNWVESTSSDYKADHLETYEEIQIEDLGFQYKSNPEPEDCPDIPNEVNDSIEV